MEHTYSNENNKKNRNNSSDADLKNFFYIAMFPLALFMLFASLWKITEDLSSIF